MESDESLKTYELRAPIDGVVIERRGSSGEMTGAQSLFAIADLTTLWAELKVFPGQRAEIAVGQKVLLRAEGIDREGTIRHLLPAPGTAPYSLARVEVDNTDGMLTPGLLVTGDIVVETVDGHTDRRKFAPCSPFATGPWSLPRWTTPTRFAPWTSVAAMAPRPRCWKACVWVTATWCRNSYLIKADIEKSGASHDH